MSMKIIELAQVSLRSVSPKAVRVGVVGGLAFGGHEHHGSDEPIRFLWDDNSLMLWDNGDVVIAKEYEEKPRIALEWDDANPLLFDDGSVAVARIDTTQAQ